MSRVTRTFLQGLAAIVPMALTLYVLYWLGSSAERLLRPPLQRVLPDGAYVVGMGVVVGVAGVLVVGILLRTWIASTLWSGVESLFARIPLVKTIYGSIKDLMTYFAKGDREQQLDQVVLVHVATEPPTRLVGLLTAERADGVTGRDEDADDVAVYLPMSYQIGGFMVLVPRDSVERIDLSVEDALRSVVTAGLSSGPPR